MIDDDRALLRTLKRLGRAAAVAPRTDRLVALALAADLRAAITAARRRRDELAAALSASTAGASAAAMYRRASGLAPASRSDRSRKG